MMADIWFWLLFTSYAILLTSEANVRHPNPNVEGRIPEIDEYLLEHGMEISQGSDLKTVKSEVKAISSRLGYRYNPEFSHYYLEVLDLIEKKGAEIINKERDRLDVILSSTGVHGRSIDGGTELKYALTRRNILESFTDAIAEYLIRDMDQLKMGFVRLEQLVNKQPNKIHNIKNEM